MNPTDDKHGCPAVDVLRELVRESVEKAMEPYKESLDWMKELRRVGGWFGKGIGVLVLAVIAKAGWDLWTMIKDLFK